MENFIFLRSGKAVFSQSDEFQCSLSVEIYYVQIHLATISIRV